MKNTSRGCVIVINQPSLFPWIGELEKMRLADVYVSLDSVTVQKSGYLRRYRMALDGTARWLTVPIVRGQERAPISTIRLDDATDWRGEHLRKLASWYRSAPFRDDMLTLVSTAYTCAFPLAVDLAEATTELLATYLEIDIPHRIRSSELGIASRSSELVRDIVVSLGGTRYVFGPGGRDLQSHYLDRGLLERSGITPEVMQYCDLTYGQVASPVARCSALDAIAWLGPSAATLLRSVSVPCVSGFRNTS